MSHKNFPISIKNTSKIPDSHITASQVRTLTKVYKVMSYELMIQNSITMRHLHEMQCDLQHILHSWADTPDAKNMNFSGSTKITLCAIHMALQNSGLRKMFSGIKWFEIGMTMTDLMQMQLPVPVLLTFNVCAPVLLENNANEYGGSWQSLFKWSRKEWSQLGFDAKAYANYLRENAAQVNSSKLEILKQWGPDDNLNKVATQESGPPRAKMFAQMG